MTILNVCKKIVFVFLLSSCISLFSYAENTITISESRLQEIITEQTTEAVNKATATVVNYYENKLINVTRDYEIQLAQKDSEYKKLKVDYEALDLKYDLDESKIHNNTLKIIGWSSGIGVAAFLAGTIFGLFVN